MYDEKPAGLAEADVTVQTVNQLEEDPSGREWALTKHKYSRQELRRLSLQLLTAANVIFMIFNC